MNTPGFLYTDHLRHIAATRPAGPGDARPGASNPTAADPSQGFRSLSSDEIAALASQGCRAADWSQVQVSDPFSPDSIFQTDFSGRVYIDSGARYQPPQAVRESLSAAAGDAGPHAAGDATADAACGQPNLPAGISRSRIHNSFIGHAVRIHDCPHIADCFIEPGALLLHSCLSFPAPPGGHSGRDTARSSTSAASTAPRPSFGAGTPIELLNESDPAVYLLNPADTLDDIAAALSPAPAAEASAATDAAGAAGATGAAPAATGPAPAVTTDPACSLPYTIIGAGASIMHCSRVENAYIGPLTQMHACGELVESSLLSIYLLGDGPRCSPPYIGTGSIIRRSAVQPACRIDSQAQVYSSSILETGGAEHGAMIRDSIIGPGSTIGQGEVTASLVGPLLGQHHHSLLIAADWRSGRGNIGCGAKVGSNHSSRLADKRIHIGEGIFFGLDCAIQFPADLSRAPYSVIATACVTPPQRVTLPFSLILPHSAALGTNRIIPGWTLHSNLFAITRNWHKYSRRFSARIHQLDPSPFRLELRRLMQSALDELCALQNRLASVEPDAIISARDLPALGSGAMYARDLDKAITVYARSIRFGELAERLGQHTEASLAPPAPLTASEREELHRITSAMLTDIQTSRLKDSQLNARVFPDTHQPPEPDPALITAQKPLEEIINKLVS